MSWKAIQTYSDGTSVRWVGPPESEEPAAVTVVDADAPLQNAGGESGSGGGEPTETVPTETETEPAEHDRDRYLPEEPGEAAASSSSSDGTDWVARFLALIGVLTAFAAIAFVLLGGRRQEDA